MKRDAQIPRPATTGQILSIANGVETEICRLLYGSEKLSYEKAHAFLKGRGAQARIKKMARVAVQDVLDVRVPNFPEKTNNLRLISEEETLMLDTCKGDNVITPGSMSPFCWVDEDFVKWNTDEAGQDTPETEIGVYEMTKDANSRNLFGSFGADLDKLCLTTSQIKNFSRKFRNWLRTEGYGTFFLFKSNEEYFVARVSLRDSGRLKVVVHRLDNSVWRFFCRPRLVVPQF